MDRIDHYSVARDYNSVTSVSGASTMFKPATYGRLMPNIAVRCYCSSKSLLATKYTPLTIERIFQLQTAAFRADLDDFEWDFVQGTVRHTEGNWSLYTSSFSKSPLYAYYNPLVPASIVQTEKELGVILAQDGPFDGVLGYSGGAALAAEIIIRDAITNPFKMSCERPFRFAVFINGASPLRVFNIEDEDVQEGEIDLSAMAHEAESIFLRPSAIRHKDGVSLEDQADYAAMLAVLEKRRGKMLADGQHFISDGEFGLCRYEIKDREESLIDIPTLHIRSTEEDYLNPHHGLHLLSLCDKDRALEFHHTYGHDFPRGRAEMKKISELIRKTADESMKL